MLTSRLRCRAIASLLLAALALTINVAHAASIFEFDTWMQRIEKRALSVQKNLERRDAAASASDAKEIERLYALMLEYFEKSADADRAVELSRQDRDAASTIISSVANNDFKAANKAIGTITRDCRTCHHAYKPLE